MDGVCYGGDGSAVRQVQAKAHAPLPDGSFIVGRFSLRIQRWTVRTETSQYSAAPATLSSCLEGSFPLDVSANSIDSILLRTLPHLLEK